MRVLVENDCRWRTRRRSIKFVAGEATRVESGDPSEADAAPTIAFLRDTLGLKVIEPRRLELADGTWIDVQHSPETPQGKMGAGIIHHVALRVADEQAQLEWRELLRAGERSARPAVLSLDLLPQPASPAGEIGMDGPVS